MVDCWWERAVVGGWVGGMCAYEGGSSGAWRCCRKTYQTRNGGQSDETGRDARRLDGQGIRPYSAYPLEVVNEVSRYMDSRQ